ncbi:glycosyltransferase family 4 protein [Streptococcus hyointestinalis]|nr:glycosyltransferase family 4 protein [Streptococcus hyointestinalis]
MKVTFCLPEISQVPMGGYKIIFEYANRLQERGHEVAIVFLTHNVWSRLTSNNKIKSIVGRIRGRNEPSWFYLNPAIKKIMTPYLDGREFPDADFIFATAVTTAQIVKDLPSRCGKKCYFIQDFETFILPEDKVVETYQYDFLNFTVSNWLSDIVGVYTSNKPICLPNPIDTENFRVITPINERNPHTLGMLYHEGEHKGIPYALEAIDIVKKKYNDVVVNIFGVPNRPATLPDYFKYIQNANQKDLLKLYNETSIFVCATIDEGFGLTGAESMACGCALVSTAYNGVFEYAENGVNALLSPVRDSEALAENIIKLIENESCRQSLAQKASEMIRERSWDKTIQKLEIVLARELGVNRG